MSRPLIFYKNENLKKKIKSRNATEKKNRYNIKVWKTIVESRWNVWVWLVGVVSRRQVWLASGSGWNLWVWLLGVVVKRYIDFLILLIPTPLVSVHFCSSIPTFVHFLCFLFLFRYIFVMKIYVSNNCFAQYKHILATSGNYGRPTTAI